MKFLLALIILLNSFVAVAKPPVAPVCETPKELMALNVSTKDFTKICRRIVNDDPGCKRLKPEKRMSCHSKSENEIFSSADLLSKAGQCARGFLWDSMADLAKFVFDIIKLLVGAQIKTVSAMYQFLTDPAFRERTLHSSSGSLSSASRVAMAFLNQASLYFTREFQRNLAKHPFDPLYAVGETLLTPLLKFVTESVQSIIAHYVPQYQCMNGTAKLYTFCKLAGDFIMPPAFMFTMLRTGVRGLQLLKKGAEARKIAKFEKEFIEVNEIRRAATAAHEAGNAKKTAIVPLAKPIQHHSDKELIEVARSTKTEESISSIMTAYKADPEYAKLFPKEKPYPEFDEELTIVISHMEKTNPGMSKAAIREKIEKNMNSCSI